MKTLTKKLQIKTAVKVFVFHATKKIKLNSFFGKGKNIFKDGVEYQKELRSEWK